MNADGVVTESEWIFLLVFALMIFVIPMLVVWATYSDRKLTKSVDLSDLWMYGGKLDKFSVIVMGTWWVHTSSMVMWTLLKTVATQDYATYSGIWGTLLIAKIFATKMSGGDDTLPKGPQ